MPDPVQKIFNHVRLSDGSLAEVRDDTKAPIDNPAFNGKMSLGTYHAADTPLEEWVPGKQYQEGDAVQHEGVGYVCIVPSANDEWIEEHWMSVPYITNERTAFVIGNGTDAQHRSNAMRVDEEGNQYLAGDVFVHSNAAGTTGNKLLTQDTLAELVDLDLDYNAIIKVQDEEPEEEETKIWLPETQASGIRLPTMEDFDALIKVQDEEPEEEDNKIWIPETSPAGLQVPTYAEFSELESNLQSTINSYGLSVVNGELCISFEEVSA